VAYPCHHVATFCQIGKFCCHNCGIQCQKGGISMPPYINFCHLLANPFHFLATKLPPFKFICQLGNFACHLCGISMPKRWHINATLLLFLPHCEFCVPIFLSMWHISLPPIKKNTLTIYLLATSIGKWEFLMLAFISYYRYICHLFK